jgi:hypothetical protein
MKKHIFMLAVVAACLFPRLALACACGCGVFDVGTASMFPEGKGGQAWLEYDYMNQNHNWNGTSGAPGASNNDRDIRSSFYTAGMQYMFNRDWGIRITQPWWERSFTTNAGADTFRHGAVGDARIMGIYSGFSQDMSSGLLFGAKLPNGDWTYPNFDRDTSIGTGSTDALLGGYTMDRLTRDGKWSWYAQALFDVPALTRGGYRPGSELDAAAGIYYEGWKPENGVKFVPVFQAVASDRLHDSGVAADPPNSGYQRLILLPGLEVNYKKTMLYADIGVPVYQNTHGNQLVAPALFKVMASYRF